jgi:transcriptional regulator with XRE-family HTH domain
MTATIEEPLAEAVARRLRGLMGEQRLSQDHLSKLCDWGRGYMNRRYTGETPLDLNDLEKLQQCAGIPMLYLLTGVSSDAPHPIEAVSRGSGDVHPHEAADSGAGGVGSLADPALYLRQRILKGQRKRKPQQRLLLPWHESNVQPFGYRPYPNRPRMVKCTAR